MQCRAGCSACCRARLSITRVEEAFLRRGLETLSNEKRAELSSRTREEHREMCPALDGDVVYAVDRGAENGRLLALYPGRAALRWNGRQLVSLQSPEKRERDGVRL